MTEVSRQIYNANSLSDIQAGRINVNAQDKDGTRPGETLSDSGNIDISEGYFVTKVAVSVAVRANDVDSYANAHAYAVFADGTQEYIGGLIRTSYRTPTEVVYDLTSMWSSDKIFKVKSIYVQVSAHRGKDDGHGGAGGGGLASVTAYQRGMPWVSWDN